MKKITLAVFIAAIFAASCTKQVSESQTPDKQTVYIRVESIGITTDYSPVSIIKL